MLTILNYFSKRFRLILLNIGIYTTGQNVKGGGGRRVSLGMSVSWVNEGHNVSFITRKCYKKEFRVNSNCEYLLIEQAIEKGDLDLLICDSEYSLEDLFIDDLGAKLSENVMLCSFVHDQIWRDNMKITKNIFLPLSHNSNYVFCQNFSYLYKRRIFFDILHPKSAKSLIYNFIKWILPYYVLVLRRNVLARRKFIEQYRLINRCSFIFSLTKKASTETALMYNVSIQKSHSAYGFIDSELRLLKDNVKNIPKDSSYFIAFSRLSPEKNIDFIIDAFEMARKENPNIYLTIVGRNDSTKTANHFRYLSYQVRKINTKHITIVSNPSQGILSQSLARAGTIICANNTDFNLTILEFLFLGGRAIIPSTYDLDLEISDHPNVSLNNLSLKDFSKEILRFSNKPIKLDHSYIQNLEKFTYHDYALKVLDICKQSHKNKNEI